MREIWSILQSGGWVMLPLFAMATLLYFQAFRLFLLTARHTPHRKHRGGYLHSEPDFEDLPRPLRLIRDHARRQSTPHALRRAVDEVRLALLDRMERRLRFLGVLVASAPLLGLLGTVLGMLDTFAGISRGGGPETSNTVAAGISEALVTTQTGLTIALPGLFLSIIIRRRSLLIESFIAFLESRELLRLRQQGN